MRYSFSWYWIFFLDIMAFKFTLILLTALMLVSGHLISPSTFVGVGDDFDDGDDSSVSSYTDDDHDDPDDQDNRSPDDQDEDEQHLPEDHEDATIDEDGDFDTYWSLPRCTLKQAKDAVKKEDKQLWIRSSRANIDGKTFYYFCKYNRNKNYHPCPANGVLHFRSGTDSEFLGSCSHKHVLKDASKPAFTPEVKKYVEDAIKLRALPKRIVKALIPRGHGKFYLAILVYHRTIIRFR